MARSNRRLTVSLMANELAMNRDRVWEILTQDLDMRTKIVPKLLNDDQKDRNIKVCQVILECLVSKTKRQSFQWKSPTSPRPKKASKVSHVDQCPLLVLAKGPGDQSACLKRDTAALVSSSAREEERLVAGQLLALHPDNEHVHSALNTRQFLAEKNVSVLEQLSSSM